jgi:ribosomal protein S18 acetylase RimI-like enzyme
MWIDHAKHEPELLDNSYIKNYDVTKYCQRAIRDQNQEIFIAVEDGKIVGVARLEIEDAPGMYGVKKMIYFDDLVIHPDYRRQGIADKLVDIRLEYAKKMAIRICYSKIYSFNRPAQGLLKKHGFKDIYQHYYKFIN